MSLAPVARDALYNGKTAEELEASEGTAAARLEQYRLYVEMTDRISARRQTANSFFLALNSAIISLGGYAVVKQGTTVPDALIWLTSASGVLLSGLWLRLILSYRDLNTRKFLVIHAMERTLPFRPYDAEWEAVGRGTNRLFYLPFTHIELWIPVAFMVLHIAAAAILAATN